MITMNNPDDAAAMAQAFEKANDEDTLLAMNASSHQRDNLDRVKYYVIPATWMQAAWPVLSGSRVVQENWREEIGPIDLHELLEYDHAVSSDDDDEATEVSPTRASANTSTAVLAVSNTLTNTDTKKRIKVGEVGTERGVKSLAGSSASSMLREGLKHETDYYLVGSNVWLLLKSKFGCETEMQRPVTISRRNALAVCVYTKLPSGEVSVPSTGRFRYEKTLGVANANPRQQKAVFHPGNVSDDETADNNGTDDLFPGEVPERDENMGVSDEQETVLLLPPSTTANNDDDSDDWLNKPYLTKPTESTGDFQYRKYGSGLGNLGNTCFMSSTLQCLAHTAPLQQYFLSGEYEKDLNRDNPLGTGGELATQFAQLLSQMWRGTGRSSSYGYTTSYGYSGNTSSYADTSNAVYPRSFKQTLGRHAEQFMGYDQHDSQEFATYLLDALHEDTNRITKKPYVEKPEQGEEETDEEASAKAWDLHLKREDSRVLENFMGQVKSRVQCCEEGCGRVSTTFDPFMYLSVPIPGSSEREIKITFVPKDPAIRAQMLTVKLVKSATILDLLRKVATEIHALRLCASEDVENLVAVDIWHKGVFAWYQPGDYIDKIRETDETFVYELRTLEEVRSKDKKDEKEDDPEIISIREQKVQRRFALDLATVTRLNGDAWSIEFSKYLMNSLKFLNSFNPKKGTTASRIELYKKLLSFIDRCYKDCLADAHDGVDPITPNDEAVDRIEDISNLSTTFKDVTSPQDVAILEFVAVKMRDEILKIDKDNNHGLADGVLVEVRMKKAGLQYVTKEEALTAPLLLRIPASCTVYEFREEIAYRLSRSLTPQGRKQSVALAGESSAEMDPAVVTDESVEWPLDVELGRSSPGGVQNGDTTSARLLVIRQLPLRYEKKPISSYKSYSASSPPKKLGCIDAVGPFTLNSGRPITLASPTEEEEQVRISDLLGSKGVVFINWLDDLLGGMFDLKEYEMIEDPKPQDETIASRTRSGAKTTTVLDCIEKYCQMEQLEESEMWYCSKCKKHVQAWKQFHIFRSPPILIVHLKRFQYTASTHRRDKIGAFIDFPLEGLDLSAQILHWTDDKKPIYDCYAVSNHYGGLGGGHYTAHVLNEDGVWCYYDDTRITTHVDPKEVVSQAAYVLYYRRRDLPWTFDFQTAMQTEGFAAPAIIRDNFEKTNETSDVSSSAAMVGDDDNMDIDGTEIGSRPNSPMGSVDDAYRTNFGHSYDQDDGADMDQPLQ